MKTFWAGRNAMSRLRVFLIAFCLIAATPHLSGNIILLSRLSNAEAYASVSWGEGTAPPQSQTGFLPAHLSNAAMDQVGDGYDVASSTSNSTITLNSLGLQVAGNGTADTSVSVDGRARASAKLIILSFTLTEVSYPYSITGQLHGADCDFAFCEIASAELTGENGPIFRKVGVPLSESGTLSPGNYTLTVEVHAWTPGCTCDDSSDANFTFAIDGPASTPVPTATPIPVTRATNLSTRLPITVFDSGIAGFIITGGGPRHILLRGIGPSLGNIMPNPLHDPTLTLNRGSQDLTNYDWRDSQEAAIIATGHAPTNDLEAAILIDLAPGAYTASLRGAPNYSDSGIGLVEIYDLTTDQDSRLANISTRGVVGTGDQIVIAGFILGGANSADTIILRGIGPSLIEFVPDPLLDPKLELRNSQGALIASDDNWMDDPNQAAIIQAAGLAPSNDLESAIAATLLPGPYTVLLSGVNNGTGVGLVEVYDNPTIAPIPSPTPGGSAARNKTAAPVEECSDNFGHENCVILRDSAKW